MDLPTEIPITGLPTIELPNIELPTEDGQPLETNWHRAQINLLIDSLYAYWSDRNDYFVGGNMFIYYSFDQVRRWSYKGPDFFAVLGVDGNASRETWVVWQEQGRYPDVIVELLSASTATEDRTTKKALYEQTFRTPDYFLYDPDRQELQGYHLRDRSYVELHANEQGRLWSSTLGMWLGTWQGKYLSREAVWLRFFDPEGKLVRTAAEAERQHTEAERQRADQAEEQLGQTQAEVERLRARLREAGIDPEASG
jgi:Uma2 family endonuclease